MKKFLLMAIYAIFVSFSYAPAETIFEYDELNRLIKVIQEDGTTITYTYDKVGNRQVKDVTSSISETISSPSSLTGPASGTAEISYTFSAGGSTSNLGHLVQYLFDWGDGTNSGWLPVGQTAASKFWPAGGNFTVHAATRCVNHNTIVSDWSKPLAVNIAAIQVWETEPVENAAFSPCSLIASYQPAFTWTSNWAFASYTIYVSSSPVDFKTFGVLITKAAVGTAQSWTPTALLWKTIMTSGYNKGDFRDIYWKVVGTRADKETVESGVRSFSIGPPQTVTISAPANGAILPGGNPPTFEFSSSCNDTFKVQVSSLSDFSVLTKIKTFTFTSKDPNAEPVVKRTLTSLQWNSVKTLVGTGEGYFRIEALDGINRETTSETRPFTIE